MDRRCFLSALAGAAVSGCAGLPSAGRDGRPALAVTIDDFNLGHDGMMSGTARDAAIRKVLTGHGIQAAGFVAGRYVDAEVAPRVLQDWSADGHILGNHSFAHGYYSGGDPQAYMADILKCEALLKPYAGFRKVFRYPFLAEGKTAEGRDELRRLLREAGYGFGHVTIDASDWFYASRLQARLKVDANAELAPYRQAYLDHLWDRAVYYDDLAREVFGRRIIHTLLLHHNLTTGLFLDDALRMFRAKGWRLASAADAFAQAEFAQAYDTMPSGQSLAWAAAKASGRYEGRLRYPAEDSVYEAPKLDALGL